MKQYLNLLLVITIFCIRTESAKILGVFLMPGRSHYMAGNTLMKILAERGHEVTLLGVLSEENLPKNFKQVVLTGMYESFMEKHGNIFEKKISNPFVVMMMLTYFSGSLIEKSYSHPNFQNFMKSGENFDVVIMEDFQSEGMKYIAHHFKAPLIVFSSVEANVWLNPYQGNPEAPSYVPVVHLQSLTSDMTFLERTLNSIVYVVDNLIRVFFRIPYHNWIVHKYYPDAPHLNDLIYNVSLALLNSDTSVQEALPKVPSMKNIGGFHIKKSKPLPEDLQNILDTSKHGVIYFSMGSSLRIRDMPKDKLKLLIETFSNLKETVLWKVEDESLLENPSNVITRKWLPQNDILAHKNVKLFITHGGLFSTMEAVYHGVPMLALPVFADQMLNANRAANNGIAKLIPFETINEEKLGSYIQKLLENPKYKENALRRSRIMTDKPMTPADSVNYWVEYVIRHQGAQHLRVASLNLAWYQYLLLDVGFFIIIIMVISFVVSIYVIRVLLKLICRKISRKRKIH